MTEGTAEEWGRLAVSLPGWRWMPGMLAKPLGYRALRVDGEGRTWGVCQDEQTDQNPWPFAWDWLPDLNDPGTMGCLLALVREALGDPDAHCECLFTGEWVVIDGKGNAVRFPKGATEAEALVAALEAAP